MNDVDIRNKSTRNKCLPTPTQPISKVFGSFTKWHQWFFPISIFGYMDVNAVINIMSTLSSNCEVYIILGAD